jgi:hypothetical protein
MHVRHNPYLLVEFVGNQPEKVVGESLTRQPISGSKAADGGPAVELQRVLGIADLISHPSVGWLRMSQSFQTTQLDNRVLGLEHGGI